MADSATEAGLHSFTHCLTTGEEHNALSAFIITLIELKKKGEWQQIGRLEGGAGDGCSHTAMFGNSAWEDEAVH